VARAVLLGHDHSDGKHAVGTLPDVEGDGSRILAQILGEIMGLSPEGGSGRLGQLVLHQLTGHGNRRFLPR
jgi:hypothetical protein